MSGTPKRFFLKSCENCATKQGVWASLLNSLDDFERWGIDTGVSLALAERNSQIPRYLNNPPKNKRPGY